MNIWVPEEHDGTVMVWIFGGGFFSGSPSLQLYDGTVLASKRKAIVVNINYRLGPFGFLYFGEDSPIQGNMGLLDQQLALRWVYENIEAFGGNKNKITIFGESAGSASTTAHLFAPGSHKYFQKIIVKSGSVLNSWAVRPPETMLDVSMQLAKRLNCSGQAAEKIYQCLRNVPAAILQKEAEELTNQIETPMTFAFVPVSEEPNFFQGNIYEKIKKRDLKKDLSVIIGTVKDEGTYWLPYYMSELKYGFNFNHTISAEDPHNKALITNMQYKESINAFMPYFGNSPLVKHAVMNAYLEVSDKQNPEEKLRDGVGRFLGDYFFTCSVIEFADLLSDNIYGPVYMYYFTHRSSANPWPKWMGVMHGYEIESIFGQPFFQPSLYEESKLQSEQQFSNYVMQLWTDFARTG
ncbi:hypothetical protein WR25_09601 isoform B [Diploscapter pachys]|uniref:Carboxylic ester hydrolase n=1 Tax=Diploscapter pachys TaxID=2018661 RepID=A0A2A2LUF3_9BILA|nr:hypothetical protein WR25_09601 isoform A [Diploscapter pachys]PAV89842.1 hypothetical protein WR25_09601 isoform B [Diploscapter pachys]